jgi:hypothetical protein
MRASDAILKPLLRTGARKWMLCVLRTSASARLDKPFAAQFASIFQYKKEGERESEREGGEGGRVVFPNEFFIREKHQQI